MMIYGDEVLNIRLNNPDVYYYPNVNWFKIFAVCKTAELTNSRKVKYYNIPISLDIETSSFMLENIKCANMYAWGISIFGYVILGRTWSELLKFYNQFITFFDLNDKQRIIIFVHNLAYEFQFMCHRFKWKKVFALDERKPIYAVTEENVEFRCSYQLSGYSLEKVGENLLKYKIKKLIGNLDYDLVRHHETPLLKTEWQYLINDVQIVVAYIQETIENDGGLNKIPLTKTGYVRNFCRELCFKDKYYRPLIKTLTLDFEEYKQLKRAFAGGFTHGNWQKMCKVFENVNSFDFTSSYPYVMVSEKFPMSSCVYIGDVNTDDEFEKLLKNYCCLFDIEFTELDGWESPDNILSRSKCMICENPVLNNGRIIAAKRVVTTMNEVDYDGFKRFYKWENKRIKNMRIYEKQYLPTEFVKAILKLYKDKTILKDVEGKEVEYLKSKGMINSAYGMCVTDIIRDTDTFITEWINEPADGIKAIDKYNKNKQRFLFYPWGVWVTSYARRNLFTGILEFDEDYIYSDTDSIKVINADKHMDYINRYNDIVRKKLKTACFHHNIQLEMTSPKTIKGIEKTLGIWDDDGFYTRFKTLGAKRYMVEKNGKVSITVSGLNKKVAVPYMLDQSSRTGINIFDMFDNDLYIPPEYTGKNIHTYNDEEFRCSLTDYLGNVAEVHEYSSIHLAPSDYHLGMEFEFLRLIKGERWSKSDGKD